MDNSRPRREIRSFVRREGRMTNGQKRAIEILWPTMGIEYNNSPLDLNKVFGRNARKNLEIGFGMAENILAVARSKPEEDFIGIEVYQPGIGHALIEVEQHNIKNIRVMKHDAVKVFENQIADKALDSVSIFFPDPWHKVRHHKRRLINEKFSNLLHKKLKKHGRIYLATDWDNYAKQMLDVFNKHPGFNNLSKTNDYCERMDFRPLTKFEKRGKRLGHGVWDLIFEKI